MPFASLQEMGDQLDRITIRGPIAINPISGFQVAFNATTKGATVSFTLVKASGVYSIVLKRNFTLDEGTADVVNTWDGQAIGNGNSVSFEDTNQDIQNNANVYYWLEFQPQIDDFAPITVGPQQLVINLDQGTPNAIADFDASHGAVSGGTVQIGIVFAQSQNDARFGSCKIYIAGYSGVAANVAIAQNATSPFAFPLEQTGETVVLTAIAVSQNGVEAATGPTKSLTLGTAATIPAKIIGATANELTTGVQIGFPAGPESNITQYQIFRGPRGQGFGAASSIGTVAPTGSSAYLFLDTAGLTGQFEWYVFATNSAGNGTHSDQILTVQSSLTSADQPPNAPSNNTNFATVDSVDSGTDVTIRIYGTGGVGSSWTRPTGFGTETFTAGTILHKSYSTKYWVVWDKVNLQYIAFTSSASALGDNFAFAGTVQTVDPGGTGGAIGGGRTTGGGGGGNKLPQ